MYSEPTEHLIDHLVRVAFALEGNAELVAAQDARIAERTATAGIALPIELVARRFELGPDAVALLIAAALPGLDVQLAARWQAESAEPERRVHELIDLVQPAAGLAALRPLVDARLIRLASSRAWVREAPVLQRVVTVPACVTAALRGDFAIEPELALVAEYRAPAETAAAVALDGRGLVVVGPAAVGKATAIATAAAREGRGALVAGLDVIAALGDAQRCLAELVCQARLVGDALVLRAGDGLDALPLPMRRDVVQIVERGDAVLTCRDVAVARELREPRVIAVEAPPPAVQAAVWRERLGDIDADAVVARCSLPIGEILEAASAVSTPTTDGAIAAARARLQHRLGDVASVVTTSLDWSDLVVREDLSRRIFEIIAAVQHRRQVLDGWGFAAKLPYGRSISALLSGPPGTGKTMVATLIAKELGLELFRVDLSKVVSKWLGETEKNLGTVFDEAARANAVLLFDEADALFGKRTAVRSSNDRNANLEVNYLLQRLESHDGIVLLTTNFASSIDDAFKRRLRFRIEFPRPASAEREALWRAMLPPRAPLADDVDLAAIAQRFDLAGGFIKNAVVRAAFLAAQHGAPAIDHDTLLHAATLEWTELGNLPT